MHGLGVASLIISGLWKHPTSAIRLIKQGEQVALNALCAIAGRIGCVNVAVWLFVKAHFVLLNFGILCPLFRS
jgi:hypothetical protein